MNTKAYRVLSYSIAALCIVLFGTTNSGWSSEKIDNHDGAHIPYILLAATPGQIEKIDLWSGETTTIYKFKKRTQPYGLTSTNKGTLIASYESYGETIPKMFMINMEGHMLSEIGTGSNPKYIDDWKKILFYDQSTSGRGFSVYSAEIKENKILNKKEILPASYASGHEIIYNSELDFAYIQDDEQRVIKLSRDGSMLKDHLTECALSGVRTLRNQLICLNQDGKYFLANKKGERISDLPNHLGILRLYMPMIDAALTTKAHVDGDRGEVDSVWIYYFTKEKLSLLKKDFPIWPDSVLVLPRKGMRKNGDRF